MRRSEGYKKEKRRRSGEGLGPGGNLEETWRRSSGTFELGEDLEGQEEVWRRSKKEV